MQEQPRPLEIAFMGWNLDTSSYLLGRFADDNPEWVAQRRRERLTLIDGTHIKAISPRMVRRGFDGYRFDQLILADDRRGELRIEAAHEIAVVRWGCMARSCVPEEYQILCYNIDAPEPCRERHARAHAEAAAISTAALLETIATTRRALAMVGISAGEAEAAFRRAAEAARAVLPPESEIALIRANPGLSRFQKWRLERQIKKGWP